MQTPLQSDSKKNIRPDIRNMTIDTCKLIRDFLSGNLAVRGNSFLKTRQSQIVFLKTVWY